MNITINFAILSIKFTHKHQIKKLKNRLFKCFNTIGIISIILQS